MRRTLCCVGFGMLACAMAARAEVLYEFSYARVSGPIQSFSFSLTSPTFISDGSLRLAPFAITDGAHFWSISQGYATVEDVFGNGCTVFGTADADVGHCSAGVPPNNGGTLFLVWNGGGLPSSEGLYTPDYIAGQFYAAGEYIGTFPTINPDTGRLELNITQASTVPEPASIILIVSAVAMVGVWRGSRRRSEKTPPLLGQNR